MFSVDFVVSRSPKKTSPQSHRDLRGSTEKLQISWVYFPFLIFHFSFSILAHTIELDYQELLITEPGTKRLQDLGQWAAVAPLLVL